METSETPGVISVPLGDVTTYPMYRQVIEQLFEENSGPMDAETAITLLDKHITFDGAGARQKFPELNGFDGEVYFRDTSTRQIAIPHFAVIGQRRDQVALQILVRHWPEHGWNCAGSSHRGEGTFENPRFIDL